MGKGEIEVVLSAIQTLHDSNTESHNAIKETMAGGMKGIQIKMDADNLVISKSIIDLTKEIREHNGRLATVEDLCERGKIKVQGYDELVKVLNRFKKRWVVILLGAILFVIIVNFLYDIGAITQILQKLFMKV
jgi:hypothetical protein